MVQMEARMHFPDSTFLDFATLLDFYHNYLKAIPVQTTGIKTGKEK